MKQSE